MRNEWTEEKLNWVRRNLKRKTDAEMAEHFGITKKAFAAIRLRYGIYREKPGSRDKWTAKDLEYLEENWGSIPASCIARKIKHTTAAVRQKAKDMRLGKQLGENMLTMGQVSKLMGLKDYSKVRTWIQHGLTATRCVPNAKYPTKKPKDGRSYRCIIKFDDLLEWLEAHQDMWDSRTVEEYALGIEYDWLAEKRQRDKNKPLEYTYWTVGELARLKRLYFDDGKKQLEISRIMGRTRASVAAQVDRLKKKRAKQAE